MFNKIDIRKIISDHTSTLGRKDGGFPLADLTLFLFLPVCVGTLMVYFGLFLSKDMVNILIASLSIFTGLLLNVLVLLIGMTEKIKEKVALEEQRTKNEKEYFSENLNYIKKRYELLDHTYRNISFAMLASILGIPLLIISLIKNQIISSIAHLISYFLLGIFVLTLLMILKRIHAAFTEEIKLS